MQPAACHSQAWKTSGRDDAVRELTRARRRQLELALQGKVLASAAYAEQAKAIHRRLATWREADAHEAIPA